MSRKKYGAEATPALIRHINPALSELMAQAYALSRQEREMLALTAKEIRLAAGRKRMGELTLEANEKGLPSVHHFLYTHGLQPMNEDDNRGQADQTRREVWEAEWTHLCLDPLADDKY